MGQRGSAPAPAEVHQLFGNPSKLGADQLQPLIRPESKAPAQPRFLGALARAEWKRISKQLEKVSLVTELDRAVLAMYCQAYGEYEAIEQRIQELMGIVDVETLRATGVEALIDTTPSGYRQIGALLQARDRAADRLLRAAREFGLTPAARLRVLAVQQLPLFNGGDDSDPMNAYLNASAGVAKHA